MIQTCPHCGKALCTIRWQDSVRRLGEFHEEKVSKFGEAGPGRVKKGWSLHDTAKENGIKRIHMYRVWRVYLAIKVNPGLEEYPSLNAVMRVLELI